MSIALHWFLPTAGDSRDVVAATADAHRRDPELDYLRQVAQAAERLGFEAVLTPTGTWCEESWVSTAALISETDRLKFLDRVPARFDHRPRSRRRWPAPSSGTPTGALLLNIVTGGEPGEQRRFGDWLDHDERYDRTGEFLSVLRGALGSGALRLRRPALQGGRRDHAPRAGSAARRSTSAARPTRPSRSRRAHADVYLAWGEPPEMVAPRVRAHA